MQLSYFGLTDVGNVRAKNEDFLFAGQISADEYLFIVADGMGGHEAGEVASRKAVTQVVKQLEKSKRTSITRELETIIRQVNDTLYRESSKMPGKDGMGTTLSVLYVKQDAGYIAHVGDSRIYVYSPSSTSGQLNHDPEITLTEDTVSRQLTQLTEDHSLVGKLLQDGLITEEEARIHPRRNVIHQSIGLRPNIQVQVIPEFSSIRDQKFLLCSDGLHGVVSDDQINDHLAVDSPTHIARTLLQKAKAGGAPDNVSIIVVSAGHNNNDTTIHDSTINDNTMPEQAVNTTVPKVKKNKRRRIGFFLILALLILLLLALVYLMISSDQSNSSSVQSRMNLTPVSTQDSGAGPNIKR